MCLVSVALRFLRSVTASLLFPCHWYVWGDAMRRTIAARGRHGAAHCHRWSSLHSLCATGPVVERHAAHPKKKNCHFLFGSPKVFQHTDREPVYTCTCHRPIGRVALVDSCLHAVVYARACAAWQCIGCVCVQRVRAFHAKCINQN